MTQQYKDIYILLNPSNNDKLVTLNTTLERAISYAEAHFTELEDVVLKDEQLGIEVWRRK